MELKFHHSQLKTAETVIVSTGFFLSLLSAIWLHYIPLVKNHLYGYPDEWFPSVSAAIGDHYPSRNIIQFSMALAATFRFSNIRDRYNSMQSIVNLAFDLLRTVGIGGVVYITSCDSGFLHSVFMGTYVGTTLLFMYSLPAKCMTPVLRQIRNVYLCLFPIIVLFLYRHRVSKIPGAYSLYSLIEWAFIPLDISFSHNIDLANLDRREKKNDDDRESDERTNSGAFSFDDVADHLYHLWNALLFWTYLTALPQMLWFFPLWNMGLSGYEIVMSAYLAPVLVPLIRETARRWVKPRFFSTGSSLLWHVVSAMPLLCASTPEWSPRSRLGIVFVATSVSMYRWFSILHTSNAVVHMALGLLLHLSVKFAFDSVQPLWPTMAKEPQTVYMLLTVHFVLMGIKMLRTKSEIDRTCTNDRWWTTTSCSDRIRICSSVGLGCGMYILHAYATDLEILPLRVYGNNAHIGHQFLVMLQGLADVYELFSLGTRGSTSIGMGLSLGIFLVTLITAPKLALLHPCMLGMKSLHHCAVVLERKTTALLAMSTYILLLFADVWTVAYAFVPGGNLLRERSNLIFVCSFVLYLSMHLITKEMHDAYSRRKLNRNIVKKSLTTATLVLLAVANLTTTAIKSNIHNNRDTLVKITDDNVLTVGIWTIHFGLDNNMYLSDDAMSNLTRKMDLDVLGLLESDTMRTIGGNRNLVTRMAKSLDMLYVYGPAPNENTWGCSMLSKYPILSARHHLLPSPVGELACAIHATIQTRGGKKVDIIVSHNGQEEDLLDRRMQTGKIAELATSTTNPLIFAGYLVTKPGKGHEIYDIMTEKGGFKDIFPNDKWRWCQYIMYRDIFPLAYARVSQGSVTDTELQTAKFWVGNDTDTIYLNDATMYPKDLVGREWNGHTYVVWSEPIYDPSKMVAV